jgi:hypothetical protein
VNLFPSKISEIVGNMKFELGQVGGRGFKLFTMQHYAKWFSALVEPGKELREHNDVGCIGDSITKKKNE